MLLPEIPSVQSFINHIRFEKRYSAHTVRSYGDDLTEFFNFLQLTYQISNTEEVSAIMIRSWMAEMSGRSIGARSINRRLSCLKSFFKFCRLNSIRADNPSSAIKLLKTRSRLPSFVDEKQMDTLFNVVEFSDDQQGISEELIMSVLYQTGIRVGELVSIRPESFDFYQKTLRILGKGNKERIIPVSQELLDQVKKYISGKEQAGVAGGLLFTDSKNKAFTARKVYDVVKRRLSQVTTAEKKSPHVLRHSFATHLTNNGADLNAVKELLGHSSLAATQIYTHNSIEKLRDIHRKSHPKG